MGDERVRPVELLGAKMVRLHVALLAAVAALSFNTNVFAADMPTKMPIKAPPLVGYAWDGFYVGGYVGTGLSQNTAGTPTGGNPAGSRTGGMQFNDLNFTGGLTAGYNWTLAPHWLVGVEGDIGYFAFYQNFKEYNDVLQAGTKADWYGTARVRAGYLTGPSLLYLTGGVAFVRMTDTFGGDAITLDATRSQITKVGWVAGAGIETKLSRSWSAKTEYLFIDTGTHSFGSDPFGVGVAPGSGALVNTDYKDHTYHVIKTGLNYNFGGGGAGEGIPFFDRADACPRTTAGAAYTRVSMSVAAFLILTPSTKAYPPGVLRRSMAPNSPAVHRLATTT